MDKQVTVLEEIITDVAVALYQKWYNALPENEKNNDKQISVLRKNAQEVTLFIIQLFMDKFNSAAEELKDKD